jgi:hypothetical protein
MPEKQRKGDAMLTIGTSKLIGLIRDAPAVEPTLMDDGTAYLYHRIYVPLSKGAEVSLFSLDFDLFDEADIRELGTIHDNIEKNCNKANGIRDRLYKQPAECKPVLYV